MKISVITLFPEMFESPFKHSIIKRAQDKKLLKLNFVNLRNFGIGKHKLVDDTPYGGGNGMVLRVDVLKKAIDYVLDKKLSKRQQRIVLLSAHGKTFNQGFARKYSKLKHLILICGHYEGFDERIKNYIDEEISVGDFILTGGEIVAASIIDSVVRNIPGVLKKSEAVQEESFSKDFPLEYPQYTKPAEFEGNKVPEVLLSGDHKKIKEWKINKSKELTKKLRPDLLKQFKE